ncbi:MAG: molybdopterin-binding protein [Candidatus Bathyarchaeota archaeon]|nr:molybdopterin-binding protein [Candidatus Bathyarchaeota archaeon]MDH5495417.1 molybdopterin-binding protein [Candidatus Bathyarchaeota archaeon]
MFKKLLSLDEAKKRIEEAFSPKPLRTEKIPLLKAVGRVLAEDVASPINVPPFHRSTVDGYAVRAEDTFGAEEDSPAALRLMGHVNVGEMSSLTVERGSTVEIVTGAPLPTNTDAVAMVENTTQKDGKILVYKPVARGENIMPSGSDIHKDETVLKRGTSVSSRELGVLAALGVMQVKVFKQPRVAIVSTGAEIVEPGKPLPPGKIYDINTTTLAAAVLESGGEPIGFGIVQDDDEELLKETLRKVIDVADAVITSGGVSVGPKDVVPQIIDKLGKPGLVVHGVAVKPGKPVAVAIIDSKPVFSLPGNPTSSLLMFHLLVRPILFRMAGKEEKPFATVKAIVTAKLFSARGRRTFVTVTLSRDNEGRWLASPVPTGQSGAITTLAKANGYVELKETQQFIEAREEVNVFLFKALED